ncbi:MAG: histidinol-phosphate transaminase [Chitinispirillales bacterium]|jgi:histidinol-phosphate aminotransferase|nr:histidinol-phosphate transaminase [Chitinispirillales bacterium]
MEKNATEQALSLVNDSVRKLKAYHLEPEEYAVKLNQNENPHDWPAEVKERAARFLVERPWNRYPNFVPDALKEKLARYAGVAPANVIVGNGSNEMLLVLLLSFAAKAKSAVICSPTFTVYKLLCDGMDTRTVNVSLDNNLQYDVNAIKKAVSDNPGSMLIICSPNNPVGNTLSEDDFKSILDIHTGVCILDQAYVEFGGFDGIKFLPDYPNLIIARTFSKAMAAAGLRLGYMIGAAEMIAEINKIKLPYNINFFTEYTASLILENTAIIKDTVSVIIDERDKLVNRLAALPFENVYPSEANFILVRTPQKQKLFDRLKKDGILIRDVSSYHLLENCLRISVGTKDENIKLCESLDNFFTQN